MAQYTYNDSEMSALIETFAQSRQAFAQVYNSVSLALGILRTVSSAGGDLGSAIDGTVLGNVNNVASQSEAVLDGMTKQLARLREAQSVLNKGGGPSYHSGARASSASNDGVVQGVRYELSGLLHDLEGILD